ncbi:MAG: hypothetical protein UHY68_01840 [Acutalibacteraceae bacterium]|nr:hypothetical protein [Acutalibacteraceae bacterium]
MAFMYNKDYDISLFETEEINEEEKEKEIKIKKEIEEEAKEEQLRRSKIESIVKGIACGAIVAVMLGCVIMKQAQLTELNQQITNANKKLEEQQSLYIQTQMKVESKYSSDIVEESAQSELGMSRADSYQKEYISLSEGDKAEVSETGGTNIFETMANAIADLWS